MTDEKPRECPDSGRCHHECRVGCFRVEHAAPLTMAGYPHDRWPHDVVEAFTPSDGHL